ncbi:MAG: fibronectin type III domain-containing protein [Patescibacteria group bacterium]|jgi:hypothetical protein
MKNWLKTILITILLLNSFAYGFEASAQISIYNIQIENIKDSNAILKWRTNEDVKSEIRYGLDAKNLDTKWSNNVYKKSHEASLYGLEEDKDYFYQITLYSRSGEKLELYPRSFSTDNMEDTRAPNFIDTKVVQTVGNTVAIAWEANEKVYSEIQYYKEGYGDNRSTKKVSGYKTYNQYFIYDLSPNSQYYIKITIRDKAGNKKSDTVSVNTANKFDKNIALELRNIEPLAFNTSLVSNNQAIIKFQSNLAAKAYIKYGLAPNKLNKKIYINDQKLSTNYQVTIDGLEANTIYYYNIYVDGAVYNKKTSVEGLSFVTKASVLGVKESAENLDSDYDQLSNALEMTLGTNPYNADSDNDGYRDGIEVMNGYNPLGFGKWYKKIDFFYGKPRLDLEYEQNKATELKKAISKKLPYVYINANTWNMLVNAYVYGNYPIDAIIMYVKLDGKTVHPDIAWNTWKDNPDYTKYAKYIKN